MKLKLKALIILLLTTTVFCGCALRQDMVLIEPGNMTLKEVAQSERQWTGIAFSRDGRMFVNFPRWSDNVPVSVAVVQSDGSLLPYPDKEWNSWDEEKSARDHFVCVQSVYVDPAGFLWILDPANPKFQGVVEDGPKLLKIDPETGWIKRKFMFDQKIAPENSYLNDVRVDTMRNFAYITDSGAGALIVVDLDSGETRRVLENHPSTKADDITLIIGGKAWLRPDGSKPKIHADGIALDMANDWVYFQSLTGRTLYGIRGEALRNHNLSDNRLGRMVKRVTNSGAADGLIFAPDRCVYISSLEHDAIKRICPIQGPETVINDPRISWPDSFAIGPDGYLYFTTSKIHIPDPPEPYKIFKLIPKE
mgnify:CR=1 FL=1